VGLVFYRIEERRPPRPGERGMTLSLEKVPEGTLLRWTE